MSILPGDVVYSKAGRDKGSYFIVMRSEGEFAFLCNGKARKTDRPKKKKLKHLAEGMGHSEFIEKKLLSGDKVTNREIRRSLDEYNNPDVQLKTETEAITSTNI